MRGGFSRYIGPSQKWACESLMGPLAMAVLFLFFFILLFLFPTISSLFRKLMT
jgi:hypothetical protein